MSNYWVSPNDEHECILWKMYSTFIAAVYSSNFDGIPPPTYFFSIQFNFSSFFKLLWSNPDNRAIPIRVMRGWRLECIDGQCRQTLKGPMKCKCMCWFIIPWSSLMWPKDYLNMCHIFYYNFSVNFLQSTWIRPQKIFQTKILVVTSLVNHHPVNIIISKDKGMLDSQG